MNSALLLLLTWLACTRVVVPILLYQLAWGRVWPEGSRSLRGWVTLALLCPERAIWRYHQEERHTRPQPVGVYCGQPRQ